jgi:hypothetical protein
VTEGDLEMQIARDFRDQERRREQYLADRDLEQLLAATNARRRARGLSERTLKEVRQEFAQRSSSEDARKEFAEPPSEDR